MDVEGCVCAVVTGLEKAEERNAEPSTMLAGRDKGAALRGSVNGALLA